MRIALNAAAFYAGWFAAVTAAAAGQSGIAAAAILAVIALHLVLSRDLRRDLGLIVAAMVVGTLVEAGFLQTGAFAYAAPGPIPALPPLWLVLIWGAFATLLTVSLSWLAPRPLLGAVLGAIGGPLSYAAGTKIGAMTIAEPLWWNLGLVGLAWAIAFPLLMRIAATREREPENR